MPIFWLSISIGNFKAIAHKYQEPLNFPMDIDNQKIGIAIPLSGLFSTIRDILDPCSSLTLSLRGKELGNVDEWLVDNEGTKLRQLIIKDIEIKLNETYSNISQRKQFELVSCKGIKEKQYVDKSDPSWDLNCDEVEDVTGGEQMAEDEKTYVAQNVLRVSANLKKFNASVKGFYLAYKGFALVVDLDIDIPPERELTLVLNNSIMLEKGYLKGKGEENVDKNDPEYLQFKHDDNYPAMLIMRHLNTAGTDFRNLRIQVTNLNLTYAKTKD
jgi:hypothetical protein